MTKLSIPIWLDCDPGNDDAFAILLSLFDSRFQLLGISTVHGNAPISMTTHNTLGLLDLLRVYNKVKVYKGAEFPLKVPSKFALEVHGKNGLADIEFSENTINEISQDMDCIEAMKQTIDLNSENINLVCTGTLTNVAKLITKYPDVTSQIKWVSIMGGSFGFGNITPYAEFNFHTDPHAAKLVIQELSNKVILSPLNFTHKVIATSEIRKHMYDDNNEKRSSPIRNLFFRILTFYYKVYAANGFLEGPPIHDPLAVYSLLPFFNSFEQYGYTCAQKNIDIITEGVRMGESVIVEGGNTDKGVYIGEVIDNKKFWDSILLALQNADLQTKN